MGGNGSLTTRIGPITRQCRLDTLVTGLLRGGGPAGRRGALAARRSGRNERFLVGMALVDVSREEIACEEEQRGEMGEMEMSGAAGDGRWGRTDLLANWSPQC
jgi:hypothetical protein